MPAGGTQSFSSERRLPGDGGPTAPKAAVDVKVLASACDGIAIFQQLRSEDRMMLYQSMYQLEYQPGEDVVRQVRMHPSSIPHTHVVHVFHSRVRKRRSLRGSAAVECTFLHYPPK